MAKRRTLETTAFGVRVFDTYGIPAKNPILTLRNCGLNKRMHFTFFSLLQGYRKTE